MQRLSRFQIDTLIANCKNTKIQLREEWSMKKVHTSKSLFNHLIESQDKCIATLTKMKKEDVAMTKVLESIGYYK